MNNKKFKVAAMLNKELKSLTEMLPKELRKQFLKESYIAGGSIYCTYNDKPFKDIDVFIQTEDLKHKLLEYFKSLNGLKVKFYEGGSLYRGIFNQLPLIITNNAISIGYFQIVLKDYGSPEDVINRFDFKHNMYYVKDCKFKSLVSDKYLESNEIHYNEERARDIVGTIMRVPKFIERGMSISHRELSKMLLKLHKVGFNEEEIMILEGKTSKQSFGSGE